MGVRFPHAGPRIFMQYWYCKDLDRKHEALCWSHTGNYAKHLFISWMRNHHIYYDVEDVVAEPYTSFEHGSQEDYDIIA